MIHKTRCVVRPVGRRRAVKAAPVQSYQWDVILMLVLSPVMVLTTVVFSW